MALAGRRRETAAIEGLLRDAVDRIAGVLVLVGAPGAGKTCLAEFAAHRAEDLGLRVFRATPVPGLPDGMVWAQVLEDAGEEPAARAVLAEAQPLDLDGAAKRLIRKAPSAIVVDDVDRSGPAGLRFLGVLASRLVSTGPALVVTSRSPLGVGLELQLGPLDRDELAELLPGLRPELLDTVRVAARGLPGAALALAAGVADVDPGEDELVGVALRAPSTAPFLDLDPALIGLDRGAGRDGDETANGPDLGGERRRPDDAIGIGFDITSELELRRPEARIRRRRRRQTPREESE